MELKTLIVTENMNFLDWTNKYPFKIKVVKINKNGLMNRGINLFTFNHKIKLLSKFYDIVFCEFFHIWASRASYASSKPIFIRLHRSEFYKQTNLKTANLDNIACIIAVSEHYKKLIDEYFNNEIPVTFIPNAIDTEKFSFNKNINDPLKICTLSMLVPRKRIFDLIVNNPELEINIGGKGIEEITLGRTIKRLDLKARLWGFVELPRFYHKHDIFIMNSSDESFGVSMIESMSCGLIPLCYAWEGIEEILPPEHIYHNYDDLQEKISCLNDKTPKQILRIKKKMRNIIESKYNVEDQTKRFIELFEGRIA